MAKNRIYSSEKLRVQGIEVTINRKAVKNLNMRVYPSSGKVVLSAPRQLPLRKIEQFIAAKEFWIRKHLSGYKSSKRKRLRPVEGEKIPIFGKDYVLLFSKKLAAPKLTLTGNNLVMQIRPGSDEQKKLHILKAFYREELKREIPNLIAKWEPIMGVQVNEFGVKQMKTRWGTCNIQAKRIWLSLELAKKSPECLEYVVVHEMVHLLERLHNRRFYKLMSQFLPEWREVEKRLKNS